MFDRFNQILLPKLLLIVAISRSVISLCSRYYLEDSLTGLRDFKPNGLAFDCHFLTDFLSLYQGNRFKWPRNDLALGSRSGFKRTDIVVSSAR